MDSSRRFKSHRVWRAARWLAIAALALGVAGEAAAQKIKAGEAPDAGVEHMTGKEVYLDARLRDEQGGEVALRDLVDRPALMVFVYYRCPSICDPLLRELAATLDRVEMEMGPRYRVITVSFDPEETPDVARAKKGEILGTMSRRPPDDAWRFMTGPEEAVKRLTESAGFFYKFDPQTQTYIHATSLIFLTKEGRIVRYIEGLTFLPAQIEMALIDATSGAERDFMQKVQRLCYDYNAGSKSYVLQINRLVLAVTGTVVLSVVLVLLLGGRKPRSASQAGGERIGDERTRDDG